MTEEEIAQLRSYLTAQSMRRTPPQMIEALQEAHCQFAATVAVLPDPPPDNQEWSALEMIEHVSLFTLLFHYCRINSSSTLSVTSAGTQFLGG